MAYALAMMVATSFFLALLGQAVPTFGYGMLACQCAYYLGRLHEQNKKRP